MDASFLNFAYENFFEMLKLLYIGLHFRGEKYV